MELATKVRDAEHWGQLLDTNDRKLLGTWTTGAGSQSSVAGSPMGSLAVVRSLISVCCVASQSSTSTRTGAARARSWSRRTSG